MFSSCPGLYHKLHGRHRPVAMKKGEIKRRKRVVPAIADQAQATMSTSPDPQQSPIQHDDGRGEDILTPDRPPLQQHAPPAVDFTGAFSSRQRLSDDGETYSRKRSFSMSENEEGSDTATNQPLDPTLAALSVAAAVRSSGQYAKSDRRARLEKEAESLRQMLLAKEEELAAIDQIR